MSTVQCLAGPSRELQHRPHAGDAAAGRARELHAVSALRRPMPGALDGRAARGAVGRVVPDVRRVVPSGSVRRVSCGWCGDGAGRGAGGGRALPAAR